jgi:hypothetical protein
MRQCALRMQVKVADRSVVTTADAERRAVAPAGLQGLINAAVAAAPSGELRACWHLRTHRCMHCGMT